MDDTVERLYQRLAQALQRTRRDAFAGPVTVAEIYQELVPYRIVRGEAGFDMNADYEHALLRLLAGEGDLARLEPAHAREQITRELKSPNPNVSIYREYAGCDVFVIAPAPGRFEDPAESLSDVLSDDDGADSAPWDDLLLLDAEEDEPEDDADDDTLPFSLVDPEPERNPEPKPQPRQRAASPPAPRQESPAPKAAAPQAPPTPKRESAQPPVETGKRADSSHCAYCDADLPAHRPVRFCPYCGQDQTAAPCPSCGEALEPGWTFCVACGAARTVP